MLSADPTGISAALAGLGKQAFVPQKLSATKTLVGSVSKMNVSTTTCAHVKFHVVCRVAAQAQGIQTT